MKELKNYCLKNNIQMKVINQINGNYGNDSRISFSNKNNLDVVIYIHKNIIMSNLCNVVEKEKHLCNLIKLCKTINK